MSASSNPAPIPARRALTAAEEANERLGHENLGFLSESHGFMPSEPPLLRLPTSHDAWDAVSARLPELFRSLTLREALERMPVLGADEHDLADRYLLRASAIVSIFAHAYFYVDPDPPGDLPCSILEPWAQISRRLDRPAPHLSFTDLNLYNWRLINPQHVAPVCVENIELLIPILGNEDERRFQMAPVEMMAEFTPAVGAVVRAQEAATADDASAVKRELGVILDTLEHLTYHSFMKVDPNGHSRQYVNPVVWGKTVAPLATPFQTDPPPGPSGTAIPAFQLLDIFFGRRAYATNIGQETARVRRWFPRHWQDFLGAVEAISVPDYVAGSGDRPLRGLFQESREAYGGEPGLLGRHRLKTYGFLDLSFKAGRSKTLGGFGGGFDDRLWDRMDGELDLARLERYPVVPENCHLVRLKRVEAIGDDGDARVAKVVLDVSQTGIRYRPGSRCAILPENSAELVERTLRALGARGDELVPLNAAWREAIKLRDGHESARVVPLRTLVMFGHIRPVARPVAKSIYGMTHNETLRRVIEARAEDQWELWELLEMLARTGFRANRLWKAHPGERESICWVVPPESFRMFSISSAMEGPAASVAEEIHLTVGHLRYEAKATEVSPAGVRFGTGSTFLVGRDPIDGTAPSGRRLSIKVVQPPHFRLPTDAGRPIVMFAGGTGLSPFLSMISARAGQPGAGDNWLFLATRTYGELNDGDQLARWVDEGKLHVRIAFSADDTRGSSEPTAAGPRLVFGPGRRQYIGEEMLREENARRLWQLLGEDDDTGLGAHLYVCGRTGFATSVMKAIKALLHRYAEGSEDERREHGRQALFRLIGERRYSQEIFTTYPGPQFEQRRRYHASEVVSHNNDDEGYWMIVAGRVYDLTDFAHMHPGGHKIIRSYSGMDATDAYRRARHDVNPEVHAMLPMYEIATVRRLDFRAAWATAISPTGLRLVTLDDIYRTWIRLLFTEVEMENALANDYDARLEPVTYDESPGGLSPSPYKTKLSLQTHRRFLREYLATLTGVRLEELWAVTSGVASEHHHVRWMRHAVSAAMGSEAARAGAELDRHIGARLQDLARLDANPASSPELAWCTAWCRRLEEEDRRVMAELKIALRAGVEVFERWEHETVTRGHQDLVAAARALPLVLERYWARVAALTDPWVLRQESPRSA